MRLVERVFIDLNTDLMKKPKNDFEIFFLKLMNNSVFGKTMENIENRVDIRLIEDEMEAKTLAIKPNYDHCTISDDKLVAIHTKRTKLYYNKTIYLRISLEYIYIYIYLYIYIIYLEFIPV